MSIPHKGARRIVVEGVRFLWNVRARPTYDQGLGEPISFAVQLEETGGATLVVTLDAPRPDNWLGTPGASITPSLVERAIKQALRQGWHPEKSGSAYKLALRRAEA